MIHPMRNLIFVILISTITSAQAQESHLLARHRVTSQTPGHGVDIDVDIGGAKRLFLVVTDAGDGHYSDWVGWGEPRLVGPNGNKKLTDLKWRRATAGWRETRLNQNVTGGPIQIGERKPSYGIGTHAYSFIDYNLPEGFTRFRAYCGLDAASMRQGNNASASIEVLVFRDYVPEEIRVAAAVSGRDAEDAVVGLDEAEDLHVTLFASEPMISNPTGIDIDARGRVWMCEALNYRRAHRPEGDRILILEDSDADGIADKSTVFYQGKDMKSPHGICVLGKRIIVSCPKRIWIFHDENGDDVPERKELFFQVTGPEHDHSAHAVTVGPDGRLYWTAGDEFEKLQDGEGKTVVDITGKPVVDNGNPYLGGMVFRCELDGSSFEVLGHNFRNNWDVSVDSFGTVWQSDNDDDGSRAARINSIMEYGNFGFRDELTGKVWSTPRTGMAEEIPLRHWHQNDPGSVPNVVQTGAGAPTGICVYEGSLLPERFHGQLIQCDAGVHTVRLHPILRRGAGYTGAMLDVVKGTRDDWFRPTDACVAPDGSLFVSDWYDSVIGGHGMNDPGRGRIFRIVPRGSDGAYRVPGHNFESAHEKVRALASPCVSVRHRARESLLSGDARATASLGDLFMNHDKPTWLRARALWILGGMPELGERYLDRALNDDRPEIRIVALRLARRLRLDLQPYLKRLVRDRDPAVRSECAIALHNLHDDNMPSFWAELARQYDGQDRWYLEALGIGAKNRWRECLETWIGHRTLNQLPVSALDIIWRSRAEQTPGLLAEIIAGHSLSAKELKHYFRAFDFQSSVKTQSALRKLALSELLDGKKHRDLILTQTLVRLNKKELARSEIREIARDVVDAAKNTPGFIELVKKLEITERHADLVTLATNHPEQQLGVDAVKALLDLGQVALLQETLRSNDGETPQKLARALKTASDTRCVSLLEELILDANQTVALRRDSVRALAKTHPGATRLLEITEGGSLHDSLKGAAGAALHLANFPAVRGRVAALFPRPPSREAPSLPPIEELLMRQSYPPHGEEIFRTKGTCANCHVVRGEGKEVGPDLSEIGSKLTRQALFESILFPSAAISPSYESHVVVLSSGDAVTGLLVNQSAESLAIKAADAIVRSYPISEVLKVEKQDTSLMPADLVSNLDKKELVDLVAYLSSLRTSKPAKDLHFKKEVIDPLFRSEGVGMADINRDGKNDVVVGDLWYEAPGWKPHEIRDPRKPERTGYTETFGVYADDYNRDGWADVLVIPFHGKDAKWYENPRGKEQHWVERIAFPETGNETRLYVDLFGDGKKVFLMGIAGQIAWVPVPEDPTVSPWPAHAISSPKHEAAHKFFHGLGIGDINGNGRNDVISTKGWWEQPKDGARFPFEWPYHEVTIVADQSADMVCFDADGDGRNDVLCTSAHGRGVYFCRQTGDPWGPTFETHRLDETVYETHALEFVDIDGDGNKDLVTGRRFCTHGYEPSRIDEVSELVWYKIVTRVGTTPELIRHDIDDQSGVGAQFASQDFDGDGRPDIVVSNRKGVFLFRR